MIFNATVEEDGTVTVDLAPLGHGGKRVLVSPQGDGTPESRVCLSVFDGDSESGEVYYTSDAVRPALSFAMSALTGTTPRALGRKRYEELALSVLCAIAEGDPGYAGKAPLLSGDLRATLAFGEGGVRGGA